MNSTLNEIPYRFRNYKSYSFSYYYIQFHVIHKAKLSNFFIQMAPLTIPVGNKFSDDFRFLVYLLFLFRYYFTVSVFPPFLYTSENV